jgi:hypothetical protein
MAVNHSSQSEAVVSATTTNTMTDGRDSKTDAEVSDTVQEYQPRSWLQQT